MSWDSIRAAGRAAQLVTRNTWVIYTLLSPPLPPSAASVTIQALITNPRSLPDFWPGQYLGLEIRPSDLPAPAARGDEVQIGEEYFTVFDITDPGSGLQKLRLSKRS